MEKREPFELSSDRAADLHWTSPFSSMRKQMREMDKKMEPHLSELREMPTQSDKEKLALAMAALAKIERGGEDGLTQTVIARVALKRLEPETEEAK